jgi:hypothetical protein
VATRPALSGSPGRPTVRIIAVATATEIVAEWERRAGERFADSFREAHSYFTQTVGELASAQAAWTITDHGGHAVLLLVGDKAFALIAFSGPADGVEIKGALHPLDEGVIRVSFSDQLAAEEVKVPEMAPFQPMVRRWSFDWHGRLQLPIEYWPPSPWWERVPSARTMLIHHERQRAVAHKLASAAGWPMPAHDADSAAS